MKAKVLLSLTGIVFIFLVLEVGARVYKGEYGFRNFLEDRINLFRSAYPVQFDPELGWIPEENFSNTVNIWKTNVSILEDGIRFNGNEENSDLKEDSDLILAVGDSFTFGDEVSDNETWPAVLKKIANKKVVNGGVFGYGIDQSFLRMKVLVAKYNPDIVIFSFIPADVGRSQLSKRTSYPKPYFEVQNGNLVLKEDHITLPPEKRLDPLRKILGYSFFTHGFMMNVFRKYWFLGFRESELVHSDGQEVACLIFKEIKNFALMEGIKDIYILVQYPKHPNEHIFPQLDKLLQCVDQNYLVLIDLRSDLISLKNNDYKKYKTFFSIEHDHMTFEGNRFVADILLQNMSDSTD